MATVWENLWPESLKLTRTNESKQANLQSHQSSAGTCPARGSSVPSTHTTLHTHYTITQLNLYSSTYVTIRSSLNWITIHYYMSLSSTVASYSSVFCTSKGTSSTLLLFQSGDLVPDMISPAIYWEADSWLLDTVDSSASEEAKQQYE